VAFTDGISEADAFTADAPQHDDMTLIVIRLEEK
jgi:serine phosphatase RsbU (regulator of sigma subunit)